MLYRMLTNRKEKWPNPQKENKVIIYRNDCKEVLIFLSTVYCTSSKECGKRKWGLQIILISWS